MAINDAALATALQQGEQINRMYDETLSLLAAQEDDADRRLFWLQSACIFTEGQLTAQNLVFNVPKANDFEAVRLVLYPQARWYSNDPTNLGESDRVFRPTYWAWQGFGAAQFTAQKQCVDAMLSLTYTDAAGKSRDLQNSPFSTQQTFSGMPTSVGLGQVSITNAWFSTPSGLAFKPSFLMKAGSALNIRVTPFFAGSPGAIVADDGLPEQLQYQIVGVLEGFKRIQ